MSGSKSLVEGLVFSNYEEVLDYVRQWSIANLSPMISCGFQNKAQTVHNGFRCPHAINSYRKKVTSTGSKRKPRWNVLEPAKCPFVIKMRKSKSDGSFTITKVQTEHRGHEVSQVQFKKYSQKRLGAKKQRNSAKSRPDENEEVSKYERGQNEEQILKDSPSRLQGGEAGGISGHAK